MNGPTGSTQAGNFPPYCVHGVGKIPDIASWGRDVNTAVINSIEKRRSLERPSPSPPAVFKPGTQRPMNLQRRRLLDGPGAGPVGRTGGGLTNEIFVQQALERYWEGTKNAGKPVTSLARAIHGSLLADIYTVTGRYMRDITRHQALRTDTDCALFPLYRSLHFAAADCFEDIYEIDGGAIDIYLQKQLIGMGDHGEQVDRTWAKKKDSLVYLSDQEALACRLQIKDGLFWIGNGHGGLDLFDCSGEDWKSHAAKGPNTALQSLEDNDRKAVAGFAMGQNRDIYAHFHSVKPISRGAFFHSAYMAGHKVICAGCITVVQGKLTYINNASGHYQPNEQQLALAVQAIQAQGVNVADLKVQRVNPGRTSRADLFFPSQLAPAFLKAQQGAGFMTPKSDKKIAEQIRAALVAYERRAGKWWSCQSTKSREALGVLNGIAPDDDKQLVDYARFLLNEGDQRAFSSYNPTARIKADGELATQLRKCFV
jgi:hypothetical protein